MKLLWVGQFLSVIKLKDKKKKNPGNPVIKFWTLILLENDCPKLIILLSFICMHITHTLYAYKYIKIIMFIYLCFECITISELFLLIIQKKKSYRLTPNLTKPKNIICVW